jgi:hypothetical protein
MPSVVLLLLLGFDYSPIAKHVFHVYPLPAYAIAALWMALGFAWLANRLALRPMHAVTAGAALVALVFVVGSRENLFENHDWGARYAQTVLKTLPPNAAVFLQGDADLAPIAYFHMIENWRPDITLYHAKGLVLGNRLFHPLRTSESTQQRLVREMIEEHADPIVFTLDVYTGNGRRDRWLYSEVDKSSTDPLAVSVDIPEEAVRFFEESVAGVEDKNAWIAFLQGELRRRYATLLAQWLPRDRALDERTRRHLQLLENDFYGALGIAEGLMLNKQGYSVGAVAGFLEKVKEMMPSDVAKQHVSRFFYLRGAVRADLRDNEGAIGDFETAVSVWPVPTNVAFKPLEDLYRQTGNTHAVKAVEDRVKTLERRKR